MSVQLAQLGIYGSGNLANLHRALSWQRGIQAFGSALYPISEKKQAAEAA
ncbi:hypothetical protein CJA_2842 [Cellvibrio japonicus Ueda107]|uniref:Uncharacterized protein n=1 Tax=Cellvibrio japonicus (strain Ueda107) TaxID=498211 RepID=B3PC29_CELJU|nr:hypothetical protein CJA_2842 [Cellvibrio japonicus Ueda107]